jgi:hypothetical protein
MPLSPAHLIDLPGPNPFCLLLLGLICSMNLQLEVEFLMERIQSFICDNVEDFSR